MPKAKPKQPGGRKPVARKTESIRARIDPQLKAEAEAILSEVGISPSDVIRLLYKQVTLTGGVPFPIKIPNARTRAAIADADAGATLKYESAGDMFKKLGI